MNRQNEIEKYYFEKFCKSYKGDLNPQLATYRDKPDVIYNHSIGIEITNLFITDGEEDHSEQKQSKLREIVVQNARKIFETETRINCETTIGLRGKKAIDKKKHKLLSESIATLIQTYYKTHKESLPPNLYEHIPELSFVYIHPQKYPDNEWRANCAYSIEEANPNKVQKIIDNKAKKAVHYTEKITELWLMIVMDRIDPAQDQYLPHTLQIKKPTVFKKIIIFDRIYGEYTEF